MNFFYFQLFTIGSVAYVVVLSISMDIYRKTCNDLKSQHDPQGHVMRFCQFHGSNIVFIVLAFFLMAAGNAIGYYFWDIVKSSYVKLREEKMDEECQLRKF